MRTLFKHLERLLFIAFLLVVGEGKAQDVYLDQAPYNLTWKDTVTVGQKFGTYAAAKASPALSSWIGYMEYIGQPQSKVLNTRVAPAYHNNAAWSTDGYQQGPAYYPNGCTSRANIFWPHGAWWIDTEMIQTQGRIVGKGTGGFYEYRNKPTNPDKNPTREKHDGIYLGGAGGTTWLYDEAGWDGVGRHNAVASVPLDQSKRYILKDQTWGLVDNFGYTEGCQLERVKICGMSADLYDPAKHFSAIGAWKRGEDSYADHLFIYLCNDYGIECGGDYHATLITHMVSIFGCNLGAYGVIGGGHLAMDHPSCDENPAVVRIVPDAAGKYGNGSIIDIHGGKYETGKGPGEARVYSAGQALLDADGGWTQINVSGGSYSMNNSAKPESLFRFKNTLGNVDHLNLSGLMYFYSSENLVHAVNAKTRFKQKSTLLGAEAHTGTWNSLGERTGELANLTPLLNTTDNRLAPIKIDPWIGQLTAAWSYPAPGSPLYSLTTPIAGEGGPVVPPPNPPACTGYAVTDSTLCIGGVKNYTVVTVPSGCQGTPTTVKPPTSKPCTVTPPPSGSAKWTSNWSVPLTITQTYCVPVAVAGVTVVEVKDLTPSALNYLRIVGWTSGSLQLWPDGTFRVGNTVCTTSPATKPVAGQKWSGTITLPSAQNVTAIWQVACGNGGAQVGTCGTMTLK